MTCSFCARVRPGLGLMGDVKPLETQASTSGACKWHLEEMSLLGYTGQEERRGTKEMKAAQTQGPAPS